MTSMDCLPLFEGRSVCVIGEGLLAATIAAAFVRRGATLVQEARVETGIWPDITSISSTICPCMNKR